MTEIDPNFQLHSDKRAEEREEYEMKRRNKEAEMDAARILMEERRRYDEDLEIKRMRKEAVHKAQPVRHYKPINIIGYTKKILMLALDEKCIIIIRRINRALLKFDIFMPI